MNEPQEHSGALKFEQKIDYSCTSNAFFRQIKLFMRFRLVFVFGLQTYHLIDFSKIYQLKGLEPKNKGLTKSHDILCVDFLQKI